LLGVHASPANAEAVRRALAPGATEVLTATWSAD
jgi:hypothetical protein